MNMKKLRNLLLAGSVAVAAIVGGAVTLNKSRSSSKNIKEMTKQNKPGDVLVEIKTTEGDLTVRLFGDTPRHRDNFVKLAKEGYYNGVLFHRVINEFMVQTGDPDSKTAPAGKMLGSGGPGYDIEAEIVYPTHFHKRGALAAARQGDQVNPERRSSGSQFYIVTGKAYNDSTLNQMERQLQMMQKQNIFNDLAREHRDSIMTLRRNRDQAGLQALQDELVAITEKKAAEAPARLTGMDVIDKIEKVETDSHDRPLKDVKILSMRVLTD